MAKNTIQPAIDEVNKSINTIINKINELDRAILTTSKNARENMKDIFSVKTPGDANRYLLENKTLIEKLNMELETQRQKQLELQKVIERLSQTRAVSNQKTAEEIINQQRLARNAKEYAIISSRLSTEYEKQSVILTQLQRKYKDVALVQGENSREARTLLAEIKKLYAQLKKLDENVGQFGRNVGNYGSALKGIVPTLRSLAGAFGFTSGIFIMAEILKNTTKRVKEFDQAQANLASILGKTKSEVKDLTNEAIRLGAKTVYTSSQVSEFQTNLARLGFNTPQIKGMTEAALNLATALGSDLGATAELLGSSLRGMNEDFTQSSRFADVLAKSTNLSALNFERLSNALPYVTAVAEQSGYSFERLVATLSVLVNRGLDAETAGAGLRNIFLELQKRGITLEEALNDISKSVNGGAKSMELFDKRGAALGLILASSTNEVNDFEKALLNAGGTVDVMAKTQIDTLSGKIKILDSAWEQFILSVESGDGKISNFFKKAIEGLTNFLEGLAEINTTATEKGVRAADNIVMAFKENNKNIQKETTDYIKEQIKEADNNLLALQTRLDNTSKISLLPSFGKTPKKQRNEIKEFIIKETAARERLSQILIEEEDAKESLTKKAAYLAIQAGIVSGKEINYEMQLVEFRKLSTEQLMKVIAGYEKFVDVKKKDAESTDENIEKNKKLEKLKLPELGIVDPQDITKKQYREALKSVIEGVYGSLDTSAEKGLLELENFINTDGVTIGLKILADQLGVTYDELYGEFTTLYEKDYDNFLKYSQLKAEQASKEAELRLEAEEKAIQLLSDIGGTYFETRLNKIDEQIQKNNEYYDNIINSEESSEEQKKIAETQKEKRNKQLEDKKKKEQRKAIIFQRIIDIGNVLRSDAMARSAALAPPPVGLGPVFGASLFPFITLNTALSLGSIVAQTIPALEKGKKAGEPYEGPAIWGEKRHEVKYSKDGSIEVSPSKPTFTYVQRDDVVYPSIGDFLSAHPEFSAQQLERVAFDANHARGTFTLPYTHLGKQLATLKTEVKQGVKEGLSHFKNHITIQNRVNLPHLNWKNNKGYV